jgi:lipid A 4'-phosphatase
LGALLLFVAFPGIDLWFSGLFYKAGHGFVYNKSALPVGIFKTVSWMARIAIYGLSALLLLSFLPRLTSLARNRNSLIYLVFLLALGPGLSVHAVLKNNVGRARPSQILDFGGTAAFSPAFVPSTACTRNCSFVSGHAAMGFMPLGLAFVFPGQGRRWLAIGAIVGGVAGLGRVTQGAHFLSDVVFAGFIVYAWAYGLDRWLLKPRSALPAE